MGMVVEFPVAQAVRHQPPRQWHEVFLPTTEEEADRFFHAKMGLVEFHASQGIRRIPYDTDLAALAVAAQRLHRALTRAKVQPREVRAFVNGPPLEDYALGEPYPAMAGHHIRLASNRPMTRTGSQGKYLVRDLRPRHLAHGEGAHRAAS